MQIENDYDKEVYNGDIAFEESANAAVEAGPQDMQLGLALAGVSGRRSSCP